MYIVTLENSGIKHEIHGDGQKLTSAKIVRGVNAIDSFTFTLLPSNSGFTRIRDFTTLVRVYNKARDRDEFFGRVLYSDTTMSESGLITKDVTCESYFGFLCDSVQPYVEEQNWTVNGLLAHIISKHNELVEVSKQFTIGTVEVTDPNDNLYCGIQRENTWDTIQKKLVEVLGGEIQLRVEDGVNYIDYLKQVGEVKTTAIEVSRNMKSIKQEKDPSAYVTRLIPLGYKLSEEKTTVDDEGNEETEIVQTEKRLDISTVNAGTTYIDDEQAILVYGIHVGVVTWDDVTDPNNLLTKGRAWLAENNKVAVKYSITALDLSLIGLDIDDFNVGNTHPIKNSLIGVDDTARIIKKTIDICNPVSSTIEVGDSLKTLSDIQRDQANQISAASKNFEYLEKNQTNQNNDLAAINKKVETLSETVSNMEETYTSEIEQLAESISLEIKGSLGSNASIILSAGSNSKSYELDLTQVRTAFANDNTAVSISAGTITFNAGTLIVNSTNFQLTADGTITAKAGTIGGWTLNSYKLFAGDGVNSKTVVVEVPGSATTYVFAAGGKSHDDYGDCPFRVTKHGKLYATDAIINGSVVTIDSPYKTELDFGSLRLYWNDDLCGTVNTKYWSGASTAGISLRVEDGGKYIMFSHADDTQGSGYVVDYYLNAGWSSNYDEMHIFQTSARFLDGIYVSGPARIRSLRLFDADGEYLVGINDGELTVSKL